MQPDLGDPLHEFEAVIEATLAGSGLRYERAASVTGLEADFIVRSPDDQSFVLLEAKPLLHEPAQVAMRALHLATRVREETGARRVLLVTPYPLPNRVAFESPALRVVDTDELAEALALEFARPTTQDGSFTVGSVISAGRLFAAMPFDAAFDDVFFVAIRAAAEDLGLGAYRVDYDDFSGDVVERIRVSIRESRVMVADLTRQRPNVLYEMGYAHAAGIPVVPICAEELRQLPFDVAHENTLPYRPGQTTKLVEPLRNRVAAVLGPPAGG